MAVKDTAHIYGNGVNSTYGQNSKIFHWDKAGIRAATRNKVYQQFADSRTLPQHTGLEYRVSIYHNIYDRLPFTEDTWNDMHARKEFSESFSKYGYLSARDIAKVSGNLYGSSGVASNGGDNGVRLLEGEGETNKISVKKSTITTKIHKFGVMLDYSEETTMFSEDVLETEYRRQLGEAASLIYEDLIQFDLLSTPTRLYSGVATSIATMGQGIGAGTPDSVTLKNQVEESYKVNYELLQKAALILTNNRCPYRESMIVGSDKFNTSPIAKAHYAIIPNQLWIDLQNCTRGTTYEKNFCFTPVEKYATPGNLAYNEVGSMGNFRFILSEQAMVYRGQGAEVDENYAGSLTYTECSDGVKRFDVSPILVVGPDSFSTISLMGANKITFMHKKPNDVDKTDPFGSVGFFSCKFWYGGLITRPERILQILVLSSN